MNAQIIQIFIEPHTGDETRPNDLNVGGYRRAARRSRQP
jgi:hypothetical protein